MRTILSITAHRRTAEISSHFKIMSTFSTLIQVKCIMNSGSWKQSQKD